MSNIWSLEEEAERLRRRFSEAKLRGMGQANFARVYSVPGGASMISQHISGHRPIGLEAAAAYAKGFGCNLSDISPRLAKLTVSQASVMTEEPPPVSSQEQASPTAMELALLFDLIPVSDRIRRTQAYNAASAAILNILQSNQAKTDG